MWTELVAITPMVVSQRLLGMALPGQRPSARQSREAQRMVSEKIVAFGTGWSAMVTASMLASQAAWLHAWWPVGDAPIAPTWASLCADGLRPIHRAAVANAARLSRGRR